MLSISQLPVSIRRQCGGERGYISISEGNVDLSRYMARLEVSKNGRVRSKCSFAPANSTAREDVHVLIRRSPGPEDLLETAWNSMSG